jgi:D-alanyl-D-alanine carboxypeptidase
VLSATSTPYGGAQLQRDVNAIRATGVTGVLAEVDGGRFVARSGQAVLGSDRPVPYDSYIRIGSATKSFVATVVLQLAAEGRLSLNDTAARWLPGVVTGNGNDGTRITIRELLQHTSGIYDYQNTLPLDQSEQGFLATRFDSVTPQQLVAIAMRHRPLFPPGTSWSYSGTNYILLGMIISKVTGQALARQVLDRIVVPLGLRHTFVPGSPYLPALHADDYQQFAPGGPLVDTTDLNPAWGLAAGGIVSTPDDLDRFFRALVTGRLLPPAELAEMETTIATPPGGWIRYGLGLGWQSLPCGGGYWTHDGDVPGASTTDGVTPDGHRSVVIQTFTRSVSPQATARLQEAEVKLVNHALCSQP